MITGTIILINYLILLIIFLSNLFCNNFESLNLKMSSLEGICQHTIDMVSHGHSTIKRRSFTTTSQIIHSKIFNSGEPLKFNFSLSNISDNFNAFEDLNPLIFQ